VKKYKLSELVLDFDIYPRGSVDSHHVGEIAAAMEAGVTLPPIVVDKKSKRIVDGFHRFRAYLRQFDENHEIECIEKEYKNDKDLFLDSMRFNASHGRALTVHDKVHCLLLAEKLRIAKDDVAESLNLTSERVGELMAQRVGRLGAQPIALKQSIRHMGGKKLSKDQVEANEKLSGMNALFHVHQIMILIENELLDTTNEDLMEGLRRLHEMLGPIVGRKAA
jgi:hypothetical protein